MANLVSTDWLLEHLNDPDLVILHSSYLLGAPGWSPEASYSRGHIPGARLFDIDAICDHSCPLPHMLPSPKDFAEAVGALGISNNSHVVVYDDGGVRPSFRVWWTFKAFGHNNISVLDGGLMKWTAEGIPITPTFPEIKTETYNATFNETCVVAKSDMMANIETRKYEVLDARGAGRFTGAEVDPRPGVKSGRIPDSKNLFFRSLFNDDGTLKGKNKLREMVDHVGMDKSKPVITTCGSGVTASILYFVLESLGVEDLRVYDGSWAEWGTALDTPVEIG